MTRTGTGTGESAPRTPAADDSQAIARSAGQCERGLLDRLEFDAEFMDQKGVYVGPLGDGLVERVSHAVPGLCACAEQDRVGGRVRRLKAGAELAGMPRIDPRVIGAAREQDRGILPPVDHVMIRRVCKQRLELLGVLDRAV